MSSAIVNGRLTLAVVQTRLTTFLAEGKVNQLQIKNDFMLGVVHEVVHLQNPKLASSNHLAEEQRAWREVNSNVVRKLRASKQPMNKRDRKSTRLNSSHQIISYAVFCLKK